MGVEPPPARTPGGLSVAPFPGVPRGEPVSGEGNAE